MIKSSEKKGLKIEGDSLTIAAELTAIIHYMLVDKVLPKKEIERAIKYAFKSEEEIEQEIQEIKGNKKDLKKELENILNEFFD